MKKISGNYKLVFLGLATTLVSLSVSAQNYDRKIDWQPKPKTFSTIDGKTIIQPTFTNAAHNDRFDLLPFYTELIPVSAVGDISVQLVNAVYSASDHLDNAGLGFVKASIEPQVELSILRKRPYASVSLLPFRKGPSGVIEKLESFTLKLTVIPKPQKRSTVAYAAVSNLASGNFYKIAVTADGMYKVDYNFVKNTLKVDPNSFNLSTLAIFGNGGGMVPDLNSVARPDDLIENATLIVDNNGNNKMDDGDYLLFYGQMADAWRFNSTTQTFSHEKNLYTDKNFYFLSTDKGTGKRVALAASGGSPNKTITDFDEHAYHESDEVNLLESGKTWLGDKMTGFNSTKNFSFNFPNLVASVPVKFTSRVACNTPYGSTTVVAVNEQSQLITHYDTGIQPSPYPPGSIVSALSANYSAGSSQINVTYTFHVSSDPAGTAASYIDWFEMILKRGLTMSGDAMTFRNSSTVGAGNVSNFIVNSASGNTKVWDVTDLNNIQEMPGTLNGSQLSFVTATPVLKEFMAFNTSGVFGNPEFIGKVENQNLHALGQPDMIIVTYDDFVAPSNDLADFHRNYDHISVDVVKTSQIYNEFGSGKPDISAIRDFVKMFYDRAGGDTALMPRYLLLMGDGTFDPKDRVANNNNLLPTYQSSESNNQTETYTSDDFFGLLDANEGGDITGGGQMLDIGVGRLTAGSESDAWDIVNKIKNYKKPVPNAACIQISSNASWRNIISFVADDLDNGGATFENSSDALCELTRSQHPVYNYEKIYLDAYKQLSTPAGDRYPDVNTAILNRINAGCLIMNWVGHGGETNWAHERIFNMADIVQLQNQEKLPMFITATCDFSRFDLPDRTAGEWLIVNGKGGAIASLTTVRLVYSSGNEVLNNAAFAYMFAPVEGRFPRLGEIILRTKNATVSQGSNTRKFTLLGDPALTLNYPRYDVATTAVNNKTVLSTDTLKALAEVTVKGEVRDDNGNKMTSFTGVVYPEVFDKISSIQTLGNDAPEIMTFKMYKNILFKGKASVTNGDFSFSFMVPKDIDYRVDSGRISYYADNGNFIDAHGYTNQIRIGGSADSFKLDNIGPKMDVYMNDEKFVFGGTTNTDPMLLLKLSDESGINTVGNGIGHDLTAILDDNTQNKVVLNDYYESALDNYKKGEVKYPYSKLVEGRHTLKVKAWDVQNNSSEEYTEFVVASDAKLALTHVYNYPNPFTTHTQFMFEHNRCCDDLDISVQIYTVSGKLVKSIVDHVHSVGFRVDDINWDGLDDYGDAIGKGVYVYKLQVRDAEGNSAHKFEKLVVLR